MDRSTRFSKALARVGLPVERGAAFARISRGFRAPAPLAPASPVRARSALFGLARLFPTVSDRFRARTAFVVSLSNKCRERGKKVVAAAYRRALNLATLIKAAYRMVAGLRNRSILFNSVQMQMQIGGSRYSLRCDSVSKRLRKHSTLENRVSSGTLALADPSSSFGYRIKHRADPR